MKGRGRSEEGAIMVRKLEGFGYGDGLLLEHRSRR